MIEKKMIYISFCFTKMYVFMKERSYLFLFEMTEAFAADVMIFIEQFWARWPWSIGVLES